MFWVKFWLNYFLFYVITIFAIAYSLLCFAYVPGFAFSLMDLAYVKCFAYVPGFAFSAMDIAYVDVPACALFSRLNWRS